jgi:predicted TIM-barrel fold metal-dependent hydrolase
MSDLPEVFLRRSLDRLSKIDVFDIHHHIGSAGAFLAKQAESVTADAATNWYDNAIASIPDDIARRLDFMDTHNIAGALAMPGMGFPTTRGYQDSRLVNDYVARYRDASPDRFLACGTVNPLDGIQSVDEVDRCMSQLGMRALVWHHRFQATVLDHEMMDHYLERLREYGAPALIHIVCDSKLEAPWRLERLADRHPQTTFVALDAFSAPDHSQWMAYIAEKHHNILFETALMVSVTHMIENFVEKFGPERLILGTDCYSQRGFNHPYPLYELLASRLSDADLQWILGGNARRLLASNA